MGKVNRAERSASALFGRSDVAKILCLDEWVLSSFNDRPTVGIRPSAHGPHSRGQRGLYTVRDLYRVALGFRLLGAGFASKIVGVIVREVFPPGVDPSKVAVHERPKKHRDARYLVIDWSGVSPLLKYDVPAEWTKREKQESRLSHLISGAVMADWFERGLLRAAFVMPFDELMVWVEQRVLGNKLSIWQDEDRPELGGRASGRATTRRKPRVQSAMEPKWRPSKVRS